VAVTTTAVAGVLLVDQPTHGDERGFFRQTLVLDELAEALGRTPTFVQANHARSAPGVLRGFHAEPWDKLVYVARGRVLAVVADLRPDSPTFAAHVAVELGDGTDRPRLFVPQGVGNAYCVLGDEPADYLYDVTDTWHPGVDKHAVRWDDPDLAVAWPLVDPVLSEDDRTAPSLRERVGSHPRLA
jgi:dTDP-4-dehydrorhamnose 3,5-epimerase